MGVLRKLPFFYSPQELANLYRGRNESFSDYSSEEDNDNQFGDAPEEPERPEAQPVSSIEKSEMEAEAIGRDVEESQVDSGSDTTSESEMDSAEVDRKLKALADIEARMLRFTQKLERAEAVREGLLVKLAVYVWLDKMNKDFKFDRIGASKYRTNYGVIVESLMKLLCELDDVQSRGNQAVKSKRRALVKKINDELLPKADRVFLKANKLVKLTEEVLGFADASKSASSSKAASDDNKPTRTQTNDVEEKTQKEIIDMEVCEEKPDTQKQEQKPEIKPSSAQASPRRSKKKATPQFETGETHNAYVVRLRIPAGEQVRNVSFSLKNDSEMIISGKTFELPLEVDPRKANLQESTYEVVDRRLIVLRIPKRKRRVPTAPRRSYRPAYDAFGREYYQRPTVFGW